MDEQGKENPDVGGSWSESNWRAETLPNQPEPRQNLFQRLISKIGGKSGKTTEAEKTADEPLTKEAGEKELVSEPNTSEEPKT